MSRGCVLFGSQGGNAAEIAKLVLDDVQTAVSQLQWRLMSCNDYLKAHSVCVICFYDLSQKNQFDALAAERMVVLVCSTTGQGDPPDNAQQFFRSCVLQKKTLKLPSTRFAVLGLGDTNYDKFNESAKRLDRFFSEMGAVRVVEKGLADDAVGLETVVEPWRKKLVEELKKIGTEILGAQSHEPEQIQPVLSSSSSQATSATSSILPSASDSTTVPKFRGMAPLLKSTLRCDPQIQQYSSTAAVADWTNYDDSNFLHHRFSDWKNRHHSSQSFPWTQAHAQLPASMIGYTSDAPQLIRIDSARVITDSSPRVDDFRVVLQVDLEVRSECHLQPTPLISTQMAADSTESMMALPGDSIAMFCANSCQLVETLLNRLSIDFKEACIPRTWSFQESDSETSKKQLLWPCTASLVQILLYSVDLTCITKKTLVRLLAESASDPAERMELCRLSSMDGSQDYMKLFIAQRCSLLELLQMFPSVKPPICGLLEALPSLQPRFYSLSNDPRDGRRWQLCMSLDHFTTSIKYQSHELTRHRYGLCTSWIIRMLESSGKLDQEIRAVLPDDFLWSPSSVECHPGVIHRRCGTSSFWIPTFVRRTNNFTPPEDHRRPMIMVGPGTGVAPFRGFLQLRRRQRRAAAAGGCSLGCWRGMDICDEDSPDSPVQKTQICKQSISPDAPTFTALSQLPDCGFGKTLLFFGCRHPEQDWLLADEFSDLVADGTLSEYHCAFSRLNPARKHYVQHIMDQHGERLLDLIQNQKAVVYICGSVSDFFIVHFSFFVQR